MVEALNGLEALAVAQPKNRPVGLIIDEFQKIIELGGTAAESQIRAAIQRHKRIGYVFAGSKIRMLTAMTMDAARPFYRLGTVRFIGPVPKADFEAFLRAKFEGSGYRIENAAAFKPFLIAPKKCPTTYKCWRTNAGTNCELAPPSKGPF